MIYFVCSDLHSFFTPFKEALDQAGYDKNNLEHMLIICGDIFDRGNQTLELYNFIKSIPKSNRKMIIGNHCSLYFMLLRKAFPDSYDFSNGTVKTFCHIAGVDPKELDVQELIREYYRLGEIPNRQYLHQKLRMLWHDIVKKVANSEITAWLASDEWLNYFEFDDNVCVHSFVPTNESGNINNWREADASAWEAARWGCPGEQFELGLFNSETANGKTLISGHWTTSDYHFAYENKSNDYSIYYQKGFIGLDGCTALTNNVNILKITPEGYFDKNGVKLK